MARISRFDVVFRSKRELCQCLGLRYLLKDRDLTEEALAARLGTEDREVLRRFLSERRKEFKMSRVLRKTEDINGGKDAKQR